MCTRNAQYKSQEKLESGSVSSCHSGSVWHISAPIPLLFGLCCSTWPWPASRPRVFAAYMPEQARAKGTGYASFKSLILEPPSPKNPSWKLCRFWWRFIPGLSTTFKDVAQHNNHCSLFSRDSEMSWSSFPLPSSSTLERRALSSSKVPATASSQKLSQ